MEDNDDEYFSDEFDSLPPGTLYELEQNAFQATQAQATQQQEAPPFTENTTIHTSARPGAHRSSTLKPPPRLHTGLTNDYDTLEVGELEAEVHDNVDDPAALPEDHQTLVAENGWSVSGGMGDAMEVDDYVEGNTYDLNARLEQV